MDPRRTDESWWNETDIQSFRIEGSDGKTLCRVEARAWDSTTTVYDKDDAMIVRYDTKGTPEKGEVWKDGNERKYRFTTQNRIKITDRNVNVEIIPSNYLKNFPTQTHVSFGDVNSVTLIRSENNISRKDGEKLKHPRKNTLSIVVITDDEATSHPNHVLSRSFTHEKNVRESFLDDGNVGYIIDTTASQPVLIDR